MERRILECGGCGGRIAFRIEDAAAACVFCGAPSLASSSNDEEIPEPELHVPLAVDTTSATALFLEHVQASWFRPKALCDATLELRTVLLPAWYLHCDIETHYAGLEFANSPSGKAPKSGVENASLDHLVPASGAITSAELNELRPFDLERAVAWDSTAAPLRMEIPGCTESKARTVASEVFRTHHLDSISSQRNLLNAKGTSVILMQRCELMLLPVHICAVRFRDRPWRVLVNARTGELIGSLPWDRVKISFVAIATLLAIAGMWTFVG